MGQKKLEVGVVSRAASVYFDQVRAERGIVADHLKKGIGIKAQSRFLGLMNGTARWSLDDVQAFATYLQIPLKKAFLEIEKETAALSKPKECPTCLEDEIAS